jgi:hypothetical protein
MINQVVESADKSYVSVRVCGCEESGTLPSSVRCVGAKRTKDARGESIHDTTRQNTKDPGTRNYYQTAHSKSLFLPPDYWRKKAAPVAGTHGADQSVVWWSRTKSLKPAKQTEVWLPWSTGTCK